MKLHSLSEPSFKVVLLGERLRGFTESKKCLVAGNTKEIEGRKNDAIWKCRYMVRRLLT